MIRLLTTHSLGKMKLSHHLSFENAPWIVSKHFFDLNSSVFMFWCSNYRNSSLHCFSDTWSNKKFFVSAFNRHLVCHSLYLVTVYSTVAKPLHNRKSDCCAPYFSLDLNGITMSSSHRSDAVRRPHSNKLCE